MTGEGSEYNRGRREVDEDETERIVREMIEEVRNEIEERELSEVDDSSEEVKDPEQVVREAIEEILHEEEERLRAQEAWEELVREKEEQLEESREERVETADRDDFAELEERILENFDEYGIDPEEVKERWRERFEEEVTEELDGPQHETEQTDKENEENEQEGDRTTEDEIYYTDSSGQVHVVKTESDEAAGCKTESSSETKEDQLELSETFESTENTMTESNTERGEIVPAEETASQISEEDMEHSPVRERGEAVQELESESTPVEDIRQPSEKERVSRKENCEESQIESSSDHDEVIEQGTLQDAQEEVSASSETDIEEAPEKVHEPHEIHETEGVQDSHEESESREEEIWREYEGEYNTLEDEAWRQYLREVFDEMPEEEREHFRECVRDEVETIEDFEELAKKHGLDELLEDEEVMEELRTYLDLRHRLEDEPERNIEELAEELGIDVELAQEWSKGESKPYSLKKLLDLEAFYLWDEILRAYHEQNLPQSREELEKIMRENPQLREDRLFVLERDDAIAWIEIMGMRRRGEIQKRIRNGREIYSRKQIMELSEKYRISASEIIKWLRGEHVPVLIKRTRNRTKKKSIEKAKQGKIDVEEVHRLYFDEGLSMLEVGKHLGFKSTKAIQRIFKEQGWISRQGGSQRKDVSLYEIYRLYYDERKTLKEIAKIVEMDRHTIGSILKERGWETRRTAAIREMRVKEKSRNTKIEKTVKTRTKQSEKIKPRGKKTTKKKSEKTKSTEGSTKKQPKRIVAPKKLKKKIGRIDPYDVYQLYIIGKSTLGETAEKLGLKTVRPIRRILKDNGWKVKHHEKIDYDEIYKLHSEDGLSLGRIGKIVGLTASTIRKAFKERGWETKRISINREPPDIEKVFSLYYEEGLTKEEVAEELNASDSTIRRIFREMGWPSKIRKFETDSKRKVANEEKKKEIARRTIELREKLFGVNCKICGVSKEEKTLIVHRKDGTEHERDILWRVRFLRTVKPDEWASLCHSCHPGVHWMMDTFKLSYKDIKGIYVSNHKKKEAKEKQFYKQDPNAQVSERYQQIKQGNLDVDVDLRRLLFGETCFFCGVHYSEKTLVTHRKDGRKHRNYLTAAEKSLSKLNPEEWTSLCKRCHRETHWAMDTLLMDWKEFEDLKQRK